MEGPFLAVSHSGDNERVPAQSCGVFPHPGHIRLHLTLEDSVPHKYRAPAPQIPPTVSPTKDCTEGETGWDSANMGSAVPERTAPAAPRETLPVGGVGLNQAGGLGQLPPPSPSA